MRVLFVIGIVLALVAPLHAESYSWLDDNGTFHFTEDYSRIPKKYRNKVNRRGDMSSEQAPAPSADGSDKAGAGDSTKTDASGGKTAAKPGDSNQQQLFAGKTENAWRNEVALQEQELNKLEGNLDALRKQAAARDLSPEQRADLKKEYDAARAAYNQKYADYNKLLESAKKAGLRVEMR